MPQITVGCDPEFLVVSGSRTVNADHLSSDDSYGNIGTDHGGSVGELRPKPGSPTEVTNHIKQMFTVIKRKLNRGEHIVAGGGHEQCVSIGGHIHLGGLNFGNYSSPTRTFHRRSGGIHLRNLDMHNNEHKLVYMLDFFIGRRLKSVAGGKRYGNHYGCPSDIETKTHGFEYRTPPSWLTDPILTEATLAIAQKLTSMWKMKPGVFDVLLQGKSKRVARKKDYNFLISDRTADDYVYMSRQVANFKKVIFSKTYKLNNPDCVELWTNEAKLRELWRESLAANPDGRRTRRTTTSTRIDLVICQLKKIDRQENFEQEHVLKVCRFGLPEIRIYPLADYTPWEFQLVRDVRLRPNTIYFSKELKKYLRIKRSAGIRTRFIETRRRVANSLSTGSTITPMENAVFYNATSSDTSIIHEIVRIFEQGARTKLKNV